MNRIGNAFQNKPIFMPCSPLGYPDLETPIDVIEALAKHGADLIEVGLSFSDPLADGPVVQQATQIALEKGITVKKSLEAVKEFRKRGVAIPLVLMGYYNPMLAYGLEKFDRDAVEAGADGCIVPDLPMDESDDFTSPLSAIPLIQMLVPTIPNERMEMISRNAKRFIYLVSVTGLTGARTSISEGLGETPEQATQVGALADGVIVGSARVKTIGGSRTPVETAKQFAAEFRSALSDLNE
jgi:tryptophan synthase alpha chain